MSLCNTCEHFDGRHCDKHHAVKKSDVIIIQLMTLATILNAQMKTILQFDDLQRRQ